MAEPETQIPTKIELPAPTPWPMVAAFGVTLGFAGLVTSWVITVVGVILGVSGAVGWFRQIFPDEQHLAVAVLPESERARPPVVSAAPVDHLRVGEASHRVRVPVEIQPYSSGAFGGLLGAVAMAAVAVTYGLLAQGSPWWPINLLSATVMPSLADADMENLRAFNALAFGVASVIHLSLSILVGLLYAVLLPMLPRRAMIWGGLFAPLLWTGVIWASLSLINPTLLAHIDWTWFVASQIAFGVAAGWMIERAEPIRTLQKGSVAERAGLEGTGLGPATAERPPSERDET